MFFSIIKIKAKTFNKVLYNKKINYHKVKLKILLIKYQKKKIS